LKKDTGLCRLLLADWPNSHFKIFPEFQATIFTTILSLQELCLPEELHDIFVNYLILVWPENVGIPYSELDESEEQKKDIEEDMIEIDDILLEITDDLWT